MPSPIPAGHTIGNYRVAAELNRGNKSHSYRASTSDGKEVFLKQYFEPTPICSWYRDYVEYEREKQRRILESEARRFCLVPIDIFECKFKSPKPLLFQAFEFVIRGKDLAAILRDLEKRTPAETWVLRLTYARVFLAALESVSKIGLVHGDLKPENIHLVEDSTIAVGYRPYLIDMDASILTDKRAPWHGHTGYMGTPNYYSPEHAGGCIPSHASDVFTASLILHQLLCARRPFPEYSAPEELIDQMRLCRASMPTLIGTTGSARADEALRAALRQALELNPAHRPTIGELRNAVLGKTPAAGPPPGAVGACRLRSGGGHERRFNISSDLGRSILMQLEPSATWLPDRVARLERRPGTGWNLVPTNPSVRLEINDSTLVTEPAMLRTGSRIKISAPGHPRHITLEVHFH